VQIPLVDLAATPDAALLPQLSAALQDAGFFTLTGHGVPAATTAAAFAAAQAFFALPEATKRRWHIDLQPHQRGFDPVGWQALDPAAPPDLKESFYLGAEALGANVWPDAALVPGFRPACETYAEAMHALARRLMGLFAQALGLAPDHFAFSMTEPSRTLRLLHYPASDAQAQPAPGQIGCGAHTDWGALTLLAQDAAGGLQLQGRDGRWFDLPPQPGALVVNIGDLMQRWTNDRWRSAPHRVLRPAAARERWSIAYFFDLDADALISPLPGCVGAGHPARYAAISAGEHLRERLRATTVGAA
jgi:isopenicillin N synthase-like dioxygenase